MKKNYMLIAGIVLIVVVGLIIILRPKNTVVTGAQLFASPSDSLLVIDNSVVELNKANQFKAEPGTYSARVTRLGFSPKTITFVVTENDITSINVMLDAVSEEGEKLLRQPEESQVREEVKYRISLEKNEKLKEVNGLINILPVYNVDFRIDYGLSINNPNDPNKVAYFITTDNAEQRELALSWIREKGVDPSTLEIHYRFYEN